MLTILARFKAKEDKIEDAKAALTALLAPTRAEQGCINYDLHQDKTQPQHFFFYENWESKAALDAHMQSRHLQAFIARQEALFAEPFELSIAEKLPA